MNVLVIDATGVIGRAVAQRLLIAGQMVAKHRARLDTARAARRPLKSPTAR
jgi:nucleoside-diphosphate-sugar epimerase